MPSSTEGQKCGTENFNIIESTNDYGAVNGIVPLSEKRQYIESLVKSLLESSTDKHEDVREALFQALQKLGKKEPHLIAILVSKFLQDNTKMPLLQKVIILRVLESVCQDCTNLNPTDVPKLVQVAINEMTSSSDIVPEYQKPASGILVALGQNYCHEVMEGLLTKFQPGIIPHFFIVQTLGTLASVNAYGIVPFLKATMGTILPMLGLLKQDNMRWIFAYAYTRFGEAISEYLANIDNAPDKTVRKEFFSTEIDITYDVLFNVWLQSRESKIRQCILEAMGQMCPLLSHQKLEELVPKLIPTLIGLYRRQIDPYHVTQCLVMTLSAVTSFKPSLLDLHLEQLLNTLFSQVCSLPDYTQPQTIKNHCEVLRCFDTLVLNYTDQVTSFLLVRMENTNEKTRSGALAVLRHVINSSECKMSDYVPNVVSCLNQLLSDSSNKVKQVLIETIVALAHHGHLEQPGGMEFINFIIKQCCLVDAVRKPSETESSITNRSVRMMSENALHLLTMTVSKADNLLWPHLLDYLLNPEYTVGISTIIKSLEHLSCRKRDDPTALVDYHYLRSANPQSLLARLVVLVSNYKFTQRAVNILSLLKSFVVNIDKHLIPLWDKHIPEMIKQLEDQSDDFNQDIWERAITEFLNQTFIELDQEDWLIGFSTELSKQVHLYDDFPEDRGFLIKCLGYLVKRTSDKQFARIHIDNIIAAIRHTINIEQEAGAQSIGLSSVSHLETVMSRLDNLAKTELNRKSSTSIFNFMTRNDPLKELDNDRIRVFLLLCYAQIAQQSPSILFSTKVDTVITQVLVPNFHYAKESQLKTAVLEATRAIADSLHSDRQQGQVVLQQRQELLTLVLMYLDTGKKINVELVNLLVDTLSSLIRLPPALSSEERFPILKAAVNVTLLVIHNPNPETNTSNDPFVANQNLLGSLNGLLQEMVFYSGDTGIFNELLTVLQPWLKSTFEKERHTAMGTLQCTLDSFLQCAQFGIGNPDTFRQEGALLATILPRCTDPCLDVRPIAVHCMWITLKIDARYLGFMVDSEDVVIDSLLAVESRILTEDANTLFAVVGDIAKVLGTKVQQHHFEPFLKCIFESLVDPHSSSSTGSAVVLGYLIKSRGSELHQHIVDIIGSLHQKSVLVQCTRTRIGIIRCVRNLASHHLKPVVTILLKYPLPYDDFVTDCWKCLAEDRVLAEHIMEQLLELIHHTPPYEEQRDARMTGVTRILILLPFAAINALKEMCTRAEMQSLCMQTFPDLFCTFLLSMGSYIGGSPPIFNAQPSNEKRGQFIPNRGAYKIVPVRVVMEAFRSFLLCSQAEGLAAELVKCRQLENCEDYSYFIDVVSTLTSKLCSDYPKSITKVVVAIGPGLSSPTEAHRIAAAAFYAQLIHDKCNHDYATVETILNSLISRLVDSSPIVRRLCIRGLGHVGELGQEEVNKYSTTVLTAMLNGLEDREDSGFLITVEAMSGLSKILSLVEESHVSNLLMSLVIRIRPFFEKNSEEICSAAFSLFGDLARFGQRSSKEAFLEQVHLNMIPLLLHLNDEHPTVVVACKRTLRCVGPLLESDSINKMFQKHLIDEGNLQYVDFLNSLAKLMCSELEDKIPLYIRNCASYFKSRQAGLRGHAAMTTSILYSSLPVEVRPAIDLQPICNGLILLLKDPTKEVRIKGAEAMSCLFST